MTIRGNTGISTDTDNDGLLDNNGQYVNGEIVLPKDPDSLASTAPAGIWQKQLQIEKEGNIPYYLTTYYTYENNTLRQRQFNWFQIQESDQTYKDALNSPQLLEIFSSFLNFRLDNGGIVLHSQTKADIYEYILEQAKANLSTLQYIQFKTAAEYLKLSDKTDTWQKKYGYNDLFDEVFRIATNNNMRSVKFYFKNEQQEEHAIWVWRGDYLTLGSGAEIGVYKKNDSENIEHWDAIDFELPMTLNLYNYNSADDIEHVFSWKPEREQWWITGFNPNYHDIPVEKQVVIGTIDFSGHTDMYDSLKENNSDEKYLMFDDNSHKVWICFYD